MKIEITHDEKIAFDGLTRFQQAWKYEKKILSIWFFLMDGSIKAENMKTFVGELE